MQKKQYTAHAPRVARAQSIARRVPRKPPGGSSSRHRSLATSAEATHHAIADRRSTRMCTATPASCNSRALSAVREPKNAPRAYRTIPRRTDETDSTRPAPDAGFDAAGVGASDARARTSGACSDSSSCSSS